MNVDKMMSRRWASISASPSKGGEALGIFRGYSLLKQQTQQPQLHLLLWLHIHTRITSTEVFVVFVRWFSTEPILGEKTIAVNSYLF